MNKKELEDYLKSKFKFLQSDFGFSCKIVDGDMAEILLKYNSFLKNKMISMQFYFGGGLYYNNLILSRPLLNFISLSSINKFDNAIDIREYSFEISNGEITKEDFNKQGSFNYSINELNHDIKLHTRLLKRRLHKELSSCRWTDFNKIRRENI